MTTDVKTGYEINQNILDGIDKLQLNKRLDGIKKRYLDDIIWCFLDPAIFALRAHCRLDDSINQTSE